MRNLQERERDAFGVSWEPEVWNLKEREKDFLGVKLSKLRRMSGRRTENMATALQSEEYKVIIIGALAVGKTSLLLRFVHDTFEDRISRFVSEERKHITVNGKELVLDIWDTAGEPYVCSSFIFLFCSHITL